MIHYLWDNFPYKLLTDPEYVDHDFIYRQLKQSYWASTRSPAQIEKSIANALPFNLYHEEDQIGFARVITDRAVFAYLADVIIAPRFRGKGLGKWMLSCILTHPDLHGCKILLETRDAHGLYAQFGFEVRECMKLQL
ncbi:MAG TPA: GNAT family N-acetyltransferase [Anaerolineales bacterium]|nr:GNAT family N-acetyltransferase [Anaerolineales bacterium]